MQTQSRGLAAMLAGTMSFAALAAGVTPAAAQEYAYDGPAVANVSVANGSVLIVRGDSGAQVVATVNAPVVAGDYIVTGASSDAEVQFDGVSMLRLASNTQVRFANLDPASREVQLGTGTALLAELQDPGQEPQIDTPSLTVRPNGIGDYRVSVTLYGQTLVTARSGAATVSTAAGTQTITPGYTFVTYGGGQGQRNAVAFDAFDDFNIARDQAIESAYNANPYLSPQMAGYANFASYGQWQDVPGYGYAWAPNDQSDTNFAPYQNGQWVWEPGAGYTWVDNAPFGYATSHYGTWFYNAAYGGWLWQPPANRYQNSSAALASSWLPAVVSFFFSGGGFGDDAGNANIGWIPLAPGEQYVPSYARNDSYTTTRITNVTNVTNIYNYYSNAQYARGATMVPVSAWRAGDFARRVTVQPEQLQQFTLVRGAIPIVPTTENLRYAPVAKAVAPVVITERFQSPRLLAKAPPVTAIAFKTQQAQIQSIVRTAPKVEELAPRSAPVEHAIYKPVERDPIHVPTIKPVARPAEPVARPAEPVARPAEPVARPVGTPEPVVAPERTPAPIVKPLRTPEPVLAPVRTPEPVVAPLRTSLPTPKPVRTPEPVVAPIRTPLATPKPVRTPEPIVAPIRTPFVTPKPVRTPEPVATLLRTPAPTPKPFPATPPPTPKPPRPTATPTPKPAPPKPPSTSPQASPSSGH